MFRVAVAAVAASFMLVSTASNAAVVVYTSQAAFDAASATTTYSVATAGNVGGFFNQTTYAQDGVNFTADSGSALYKELVSGPVGTAYNNQNFLSFQANDSITSGTIATTSKALGFTFGTYNGGGETVTFSGAGFSQTVALPGNPTTGFFGVISNAAVGTVSFTSARGIVDFVTLSTTPVAAVPEPATWALLLIGFGAIGSAVRGRRSVSAVRG